MPKKRKVNLENSVAVTGVEGPPEETSGPETSSADPPPPPSPSKSLQSSGSHADGEDLGQHRKRRDKLFLTEEQEQDVAEWYQAHEVLYNKARKEYKDVKMKSRLYEDKAASLNVDPCCTGMYVSLCTINVCISPTIQIHDNNHIYFVIVTSMALFSSVKEMCIKISNNHVHTETV